MIQVASTKCQTPHIPEALATRQGVGAEEKSEPRVLRVYLCRICNTPPHLTESQIRVGGEKKQKQRERSEGNKAKDAKEG